MDRNTPVAHPSDQEDPLPPEKVILDYLEVTMPVWVTTDDLVQLSRYLVQENLAGVYVCNVSQGTQSVDMLLSQLSEFARKRAHGG